MKDTKKQWARFAFYDKAAIEEKLEAMAAEGWMIEKPGNFRWTYRRSEPKKLHFSVTYFPNASEFDPAPTPGQWRMEEFCARDGWKLAARWGQMQIFYNEQEDPVPIETDPVTQVETVHRAMKKNMLPSHLLMTLVCLYQLVFIGWQMKTSLVEFLATPSRLFLVPVWVFLLISVVVELGGYFRWYRRAKKEAEKGVFYNLKTNHALSWLSIGESVIILLVACSSGGLFCWSMLAGLAMVFVITLCMGIAKNRMKKAGFSRVANRTLSISAAFIISLLFMVCLTVVIFRFGFTGGSKPVGTYQDNGWEWDVYADDMPLYLQDLIETDCEDWSTRAQKNETFLLSQTEYSQRPMTTDRTVPNFRYTVVEIKADFLYEACKQCLIGEKKDEYYEGEVIFADHYDSIDPAPWGAKEAYQNYFGDGYANSYLLCYEGRIIEIHFDFEPTGEQMKIVAEKLG